jgi:hypothetical protein
MCESDTWKAEMAVTLVVLVVSLIAASAGLF